MPATDDLRRLASRSRRRWSEARSGGEGMRQIVRRAKQAGVDLDVGVGVRPGQRWVFDARGATSTIRIGDRVRLDDDLSFRVKGAQIDIGPQTFIRRFTALNVEGVLEIGEEVAISWGCVLHASQRVVLAKWAGLSERVTITDSRHLPNEPDEWFYHLSESSPTTIGHNSWVASNSVVGMGVTVGEGCVIAANSTVLRDVPDHTIVGGSPAKPLGPAQRPLRARRRTP